jgi:hypothetical protein
MSDPQKNKLPSAWAMLRILGIGFAVSLAAAKILFG